MPGPTKTSQRVEVVAVADIVPGRRKSFIKTQARRRQEPLQITGSSWSLGSTRSASARPTLRTTRPASTPLNAGVARLGGKAHVAYAGASGRHGPDGQKDRDDLLERRLSTSLRSQHADDPGDRSLRATGAGLLRRDRRRRRRGMPGGTFIRKDLAGAGAMADIGCYSLDMALNALGYPKPLSVSASTYNFFGTSPKYHPEADQALKLRTSALRSSGLEGGITLNFKISWAMHMDTLGATFFLGTDAGLKVTPAGSGPWSGRVGRRRRFDHALPRYHGSPHRKPASRARHQIDIFAEKVYDFIRAVKDGGPAPIPGDEILYNQAIIDGVLRSAEAGREVEIEIPEI